MVTRTRLNIFFFALTNSALKDVGVIESCWLHETEPTHFSVTHFSGTERRKDNLRRSSDMLRCVTLQKNDDLNCTFTPVKIVVWCLHLGEWASVLVEFD
jgi:hypothetical protein